MINNRQQNGRRRGRGGGGGGPRPQGNPGRPDGGGNRIDNRARGNAQQLHEKYKNLARDSQMAGDRVTTEYYLQFADHYFRVLSESRARFEEQRPQQRSDGDEDYDGEEGGDEFQAREPRDNQQRRDRNDRGNFRRDDERRDRQPEQAESNDQPRPIEAGNDDEQRRERRPRRPRRDEESVEPQSFDADRLPPAIAIDGGDGEEPTAPRRRGRRPRAETANDTADLPPAA